MLICISCSVFIEVDEYADKVDRFKIIKQSFNTVIEIFDFLQGVIIIVLLRSLYSIICIG